MSLLRWRGRVGSVEKSFGGKVYGVICIILHFGLGVGAFGSVYWFMIFIFGNCKGGYGRDLAFIVGIQH